MLITSRMVIFPALLVVFVATSVCVATSLNGHGTSDPPLVDIIRLKNGGTLFGKAREVTENKQRIWIVETSDGGTLKLRRSQVARVQRPDERIHEYIERKNALANTVDAHWEMQEWCRENRLSKQRNYHLLQIIELDPDHKDARSRLGYRDFNGVWIRSDHFYQNHGYVKDSGGKYRIPEAIRMMERKESANLASKQWNRKLKTWLGKYKKRNDPSALASLQAVRDPAAVEGLVRLIREEKDARTRSMLLDTLGQIQSAGAQNSLVVLAMAATDQRSQEQCINLLKQPHYSRRGIVSSLLPFLSPKETTPNRSVNTAAWIIGQMEDKSAIRPLIGALNTTHLVATGARGGNMNLNNDGTGNGGLELGQKPTHVAVSFRNQAVLDALKLLTGKVDYLFDEASWLNWYIRENSLGTYELSRDR